MSCLKGLGKTYLVFVNVIVALFGVGILAGSAYVLVEFAEFDNYITKEGLYLGLAAGAATLLVGILGCYGAMKQNKCMLFLYSVVMMLLIVVFIAAGVVLAIFLGKIDPAEYTGNTKIENIQDKVMEEINSYELLVYNACCADVYGLAPVPECAPGMAKFDCISDNFVAKKVDIEKGDCTVLEKIETNAGHPIVGNTTDGGCGAGDPNQFKQDIYDFLQTHLTAIEIAAIVAGVVQLLCLVFSCCLLCSNREDYDEEYRKKMEKQKQAGQLTGTGAPSYGQGNNYV